MFCSFLLVYWMMMSVSQNISQNGVRVGKKNRNLSNQVNKTIKAGKEAAMTLLRFYPNIFLINWGNKWKPRSESSVPSEIYLLNAIPRAEGSVHAIIDVLSAEIWTQHLLNAIIEQLKKHICHINNWRDDDELRCLVVDAELRAQQQQQEQCEGAVTTEE